MFGNLRRDAARYVELGRWYANPGFWIVAIYRFGAWAHSLPAAFRIPLWMLYRVARVLQRGMFSVELWAGSRGARIGPGLCLLHPFNVLIGPVEIGEDCLILHEVTLGLGPSPGLPRIGNGVDIYAGAKVLGGVTIGDRSMIGANCVVMRDIPANSVVSPPPIQVIPRSLSPYASRADQRTTAKSQVLAEASEATQSKSAKSD